MKGSPELLGVQGPNNVPLPLILAQFSKDKIRASQAHIRTKYSSIHRNETLRTLVVIYNTTSCGHRCVSLIFFFLTCSNFGPRTGMLPPCVWFYDTSAGPAGSAVSLSHSLSLSFFPLFFPDEEEKERRSCPLGQTAQHSTGGAQ